MILKETKVLYGLYSQWEQRERGGGGREGGRENGAEKNIVNEVF